MEHVFDVAPPLAAEELGDGTRITSAWRHGPVHADVSPMRGHVIATHYGRGCPIKMAVSDARVAGVAQTGTIALLPDGVHGRLEIEGSIGTSHVYLAHDRVARCAREHFGRSDAELVLRAGYEDAVAASILELLSRQAASLAKPSMRLFAEQAVDLLCTHLLSAHSTLGDPTRSRRQGLAEWQVRRVTTYMREHLEEPISLDDLAGQVRLSRFHFCTAFRKATGCTPHEWLVLQRISHACELLADPGRPVTDIALSVGYETPSSFSACFRRVKGTTPTDFRRSLLNSRSVTTPRNPFPQVALHG